MTYFYTIYTWKIMKTACHCWKIFRLCITAFCVKFFFSKMLYMMSNRCSCSWHSLMNTYLYRNIRIDFSISIILCIQFSWKKSSHHKFVCDFFESHFLRIFWTSSNTNLDMKILSSWITFIWYIHHHLYVLVCISVLFDVARKRRKLIYPMSNDNIAFCYSPHFRNHNSLCDHSRILGSKYK